jgi:hypothetical protein
MRAPLDWKWMCNFSGISCAALRDDLSLELLCPLPLLKT